MDSIIEKIKTRFSLSDAINYATPYLQVKIRGNKGMAKCPFHQDNNPSLSFDFVKGKFYCHACGSRGDQLDYVGKIHGLALKDVINKLAGDLNISRPNNKETELIRKQIRLQKIKRELINIFDEIINQYYTKFCEIYVNLCRMIDLIERPEDFERPETADVLFWKAWWEELLDALGNSKDVGVKIESIEMGKSWCKNERFK
jgi:hypothetical protein